MRAAFPPRRPRTWQRRPRASAVRPATVPLLGETGCRLAEIVGLKLKDIDLENYLIYVRPYSARRLKTRSSQPEKTRRPHFVLEWWIPIDIMFFALKGNEVARKL
jgi:integrase